jgi:hypothetical protein
MAYVTRSHIAKKGSKPLFESKYFKASIIKGIRNKWTEEISVFISHKHDDGKELGGALEILSETGISLYLDWQDQDMPKETSGETANKLKEKIKATNKFILLATDRAVESKWCNWELGYGDANKYIKDIAIFPILNDDNSWEGREYLQIYPAIEYWEIFDQYIVKKPDGTIYYLNEWLKS